MKVSSENYKGIEYVQVSSLPAEQKKCIWESLNHELVIHILKEDMLLNDCLQYQHYVAWYDNVFKTVVQKKSVEVSIDCILTSTFK